MTREPVPVPKLIDRCRERGSTQSKGQNFALIEMREDVFKAAYVRGSYLLFGGRERWIVRREVVEHIYNMASAIMSWRNEIGVFNEAAKGQACAVDVEPINIVC